MYAGCSTLVLFPAALLQRDEEISHPKLCNNESMSINDLEYITIRRKLNTVKQVLL